MCEFTNLCRKEAPDPKVKPKLRNKAPKLVPTKKKKFVPSGNGGKSHHVNVKCCSQQHAEFKFQDGDSSSHKYLLKQLVLSQSLRIKSLVLVVLSEPCVRILQLLYSQYLEKPCTIFLEILQDLSE